MHERWEQEPARVEDEQSERRQESRRQRESCEDSDTDEVSATRSSFFLDPNEKEGYISPVHALRYDFSNPGGGFR